jgi:hypothetical protein
MVQLHNMDHRQHFEQLDTLLKEQARLWRPQPYKEPRPSWCDEQSALAERLLALEESQRSHLYGDDAALYQLLSEYHAPLAALPALTALPRLPHARMDDPGPHLAVDIPGRKWEQINAFAATIVRGDGPLLEWCGGKGHLGRLISAQWHQPVLTLEQDAGLCDAGERLASRAKVEQRFHRGDALDSDNRSLLRHRRPLALHACGGLHRRLIEESIEMQVSRLDLVPCCYHLYGEGDYRPFTPHTRLRPSQDDLRLAVTDTVTAKPRQLRQRDREMAWKLGYQQLRQQITGAADYRPTQPIDKAWLSLSFADFCQRLAVPHALQIPPGTDWERYEQLGWQRQAEVMRLSLVRHAFRRPLELWLVLDLVNHLEGNGYRVQLGTFCEPGLTPRNILLSAQRQPSPCK